MEQITFLFDNYPIIRHIAAFMFVSRIVFKPLFAIAAKYVELTVEEEDNEKLAKIMNTKAYKMVAFIIDLTSSIKLPKASKKGSK